MKRAESTGRRRKWSIAIGGSALLVLVLLLTAFLIVHEIRKPTIGHVELYSDGLAINPDGLVVSLPAGTVADYLDGTRVLKPGPGIDAAEHASAQQEADAANAWLNAGTIPGAGTDYEDMARGALLDLRALTSADGSLVAAHYPYWDYAWPRDNSFAAVALARTGHLPEATAILGFLEKIQYDDGSFEARYLTDGSGPPDDRAPQTDGTGWTLWALGRVVASAPEADRAALVGTFSQLLDRSTTHILTLIDNPDNLPPASPDYWETRERHLTLGTAAPLLAGLEASAQLFTILAQSSPDDAFSSVMAAKAASSADGAVRLAAAITDRFGSRGYPRHITGGASDTATAFVLPPFIAEPLDGAVDAWEGSVPAMLRPAGGLAPGGSWRNDGISWTPETAIYALAAAHQGQDETARDWLTWLDEHRTGSGALPEKVLADGSPAAVAPLAWTNSTVLLALAELDRTQS